ncbi:MAG: hypothetical protein KDD25_03265 [Bdellovibrionales bacterium]|nr:hypothetical protein [Bdellovibrionales bacterium]
MKHQFILLISLIGLSLLGCSNGFEASKFGLIKSGTNALDPDAIGLNQLSGTEPGIQLRVGSECLPPSESSDIAYFDCFGSLDYATIFINIYLPKSLDFENQNFDLYFDRLLYNISGSMIKAGALEYGSDAFRVRTSSASPDFNLYVIETSPRKLLNSGAQIFSLKSMSLGFSLNGTDYSDSIRLTGASLLAVSKKDETEPPRIGSTEFSVEENDIVFVRVGYRGNSADLEICRNIESAGQSSSRCSGINSLNSEFSFDCSRSNQDFKDCFLLGTPANINLAVGSTTFIVRPKGQLSNVFEVSRIRINYSGPSSTTTTTTSSTTSTTSVTNTTQPNLSCEENYERINGVCQEIPVAEVAGNDCFVRARPGETIASLCPELTNLRVKTRRNQAINVRLFVIPPLHSLRAVVVNGQTTYVENDGVTPFEVGQYFLSANSSVPVVGVDWIQGWSAGYRFYVTTFSSGDSVSETTVRGICPNGTSWNSAGHVCL